MVVLSVPFSISFSISVAIVIAALAGPQWLYTEEMLPNLNYNGTPSFVGSDEIGGGGSSQDSGAFITKYTKSSLWILCTAIQGTFITFYFPFIYIDNN